ncbi:MAG: HAD-IIA family hydrolase [Anaerolineaceae bacterium]|nr:HAD-IIA family hydrolase [Anaerolineaceae bacterium]
MNPGTKQIKGLILDMDGVIWKSDQPIGNIAEIFNSISSLGLQFCFATNNSTKTRAQYQQKLQSHGIDVEQSQIITSSIATVNTLKKIFPKGSPIYVIGENGLVSDLIDAGFLVEEKKAVAVVAGLDSGFTFEKLRKATLLIRNGASFYGTNPDKSFPSPEGITPGAGAILAAVETATDTKPIISGKPYPMMIEIALSEMGITPKQALLIGDRLETDILAGQNAGCKTGLVLSGISTRSEAENWKPQPDFICSNLEELIRQHLW